MKAKLLLFAMILMASSVLKAQFIPCNAVFNYTVNPSGVATFSATPTSSPTTSYFWSFGNGSSGNGMNVSTVYNTVGNYTVCLYVVDSSLLTPCSDSTCQIITIGSTTLCNASFTGYLDTTGTYITNNLSTGTGLSYSWNWGDGSPVSTGLNPTHTYASFGTFNVCLTINNGSGCLDSTCTTITVSSPVSCNASFTMSPNNSPSAPPYTYDVLNLSSGAGLSYTWAWNDGSPNSTGLNPSHTFPGAGTYIVCLYITNGSGCSDSICQNITVTTSTGGCNAYFTLIPDTSASAPASTYIGFNWSTGVGLSYTWIWGDGSPNGSGPYPSHTYASTGMYTVCLIITGGGCIDSFCVTQSLKTEGMAYINFQGPTNIPTIASSEFQIYPNPAFDKLFINGDKEKTYAVDIFSVNGSKILSAKTKGNQAIQIASLPVSLYMAKITDALGKSEFVKFTKQ